MTVAQADRRLPAASRGLRGILSLLRRPGTRRALTVVLLLVALELLMFWGYFTGEISPAPDDFIGSYNNEPFAWWRDLAVSGLPEWVPYAWGGYPAVVSIQSGAWYLPLGLAAAVSPYSIHAAAVVQALHVAFGALGVYVLGRRWGLGHPTAVFGLTAYFFAVGFYTNALHPDIVRGFAWAPWVFLVLSPSFPWRRAWGVPLAALILWQAVVGTYPGVVVALGYSGLALVLAFQLTRRLPLRAYVLPLAVAGAIALLLSAPKYVTALTLRGGASPTGRDDSVFSGSMWGTLFYPYDLASLPNDLSMRSFFMVAPVWVLAVVAWRHRRRVAAPAAAALTAAFLGLPFLPWYELTADLPGMGMSRFRMADFRAPLVLSLVLVSMVVLSSELRGRGPRSSGRVSRTATMLSVGALPLFALVVALVGGWDVQQWATPWSIVCASAVLVWWLVGRRVAHGGARRSAALSTTVGLIALAAVSGVNWAYDVTPPWRFPREEVETSTWGTDSEALIAEYEAPGELTQRPARTPLDDAVAPPTDVYWNTSLYTATTRSAGTSTSRAPRPSTPRSSPSPHRGPTSSHGASSRHRASASPSREPATCPMSTRSSRARWTVTAAMTSWSVPTDTAPGTSGTGECRDGPARAVQRVLLPRLGGGCLSRRRRDVPGPPGVAGRGRHDPRGRARRRVDGSAGLFHPGSEAGPDAVRGGGAAGGRVGPWRAAPRGSGRP